MYVDRSSSSISKWFPIDFFVRSIGAKGEEKEEYVIGKIQFSVVELAEEDSDC